MSAPIYSGSAPTREAVDAMPGPVVLEFGVGWCGHCQAAMPAVEEALAAAGPITHLRIEDGRGRPLGRSFQVKLWPTLVMLNDGREVARVSRPTHATDLQEALAALHIDAATTLP